LNEAAELERAGIPLETRLTVRTIEAPDAPALYNAPSVRRTRDLLGVSQSLFAQLLGVSSVLVASWERGARIPAPWARRLLDEINHNPQRWRRMFRKAS
jgi:DNA-binding transcriptional regulator YiaG